MDTKAIRNILRDQLGIENPGGSGEFTDEVGQATNEPLIDLIRRVVDDVHRNVGDQDNANDTRMAVSAALSHTADKLARTATALWQSAIFKRADSDRSPLITVIRPEQAKGGFRAYLIALRHLDDVIARTRFNPMRIPITKDMGQELESLSAVFAFLTERRFELRKTLHPTACQYMLGVRFSESGADRGDRTASFYHTLVSGIGLPESPENWTLRDKPEYLRETLVSLLSDLQHLADVAEMNWPQLQSEAQIVHRDELKYGG